MLALYTILRNQTGGCTEPWWTPGGLGLYVPHWVSQYNIWSQSRPPLAATMGMGV